MAPLIQIAPSFLAQAGQAMGEFTAGEQRHQQGLTRTILANKDRDSREARAQAQLMARKDKQREADLHSLQQGFQQAMNLGAGLGVDTTLDGFRALDEELRSGDEATWAQVNKIAPFSEDENTTDYQFGYIARAKAVEALRERRDRDSNDAQLAAIEQDEDLFTEAELLGLAAKKDSQTKSEFEASVAKVRDEATKRELLKHQQQFAQDEALRMAKGETRQHIDRDPRAAAALGRILGRSSKDPEADLSMVQIAVHGLSESVNRMIQDGMMQGMSLERLRVANENERLSRIEDAAAAANTAPVGASVPSDAAPSRQDIEDVKAKESRMSAGVPSRADLGRPITADQRRRMRSVKKLDPAKNPEAFKALSGASKPELRLRDDLRKAGIDPKKDREAARQFILERRAEEPGYPEASNEMPQRHIGGRAPGLL